MISLVAAACAQTDSAASTDAAPPPALAFAEDGDTLEDRIAATLPAFRIPSEIREVTAECIVSEASDRTVPADELLGDVSFYVALCEEDLRRSDAELDNEQADDDALWTEQMVAWLTRLGLDAQSTERTLTCMQTRLDDAGLGIDDLPEDTGPLLLLFQCEPELTRDLFVANALLLTAGELDVRVSDVACVFENNIARADGASLLDADEVIVDNLDQRLEDLATTCGISLEQVELIAWAQ